MEGNKNIAHNALKKLAILLVSLSSLDAILTPHKCPHRHSLCIYLSKIIKNPAKTREDPHIPRRKQNKTMKITYGNRNKPRTKKKDFQRIAIWNKAGSNLWSSFAGFSIIKKSKANIIVLSEANLTKENIGNINGEFPDYDIHRKLIPGSKTSRIAVLTKNQGLNI